PFVVAAPAANAVTISIPDFARGPDPAASDSINLVFNAAGTLTASPLSGGIPVSLNIPASHTVTSAIVTLQYSTGSLSITSAFPSAALGGASFTPSTTTDGNGNATTVLTFNIGSATMKLTNGNFRLGGLVAYVPLSAPYK